MRLGPRKGAGARQAYLTVGRSLQAGVQADDQGAFASLEHVDAFASRMVAPRSLPFGVPFCLVDS